MAVGSVKQADNRAAVGTHPCCGQVNSRLDQNPTLIRDVDRYQAVVCVCVCVCVCVWVCVRACAQERERVKKDGQWWHCRAPVEHLMVSSVQVHRASKQDLKGVLAVRRRLSRASVNCELGEEGE